MGDDEPKFDPENFDGINVTPERLLCPRHGEPLRLQWPKGLAISMVMLMDLCFKRSDVLAECREVSDCGSDDKPDPKSIEQVLDRIPACCRVHPKQLREVYGKMEIGTRKRCQGCKRKRLGTPYKTQAGDFDHLCFDCVVDPASWRAMN